VLVTERSVTAAVLGLLPPALGVSSQDLAPLASARGAFFVRRRPFGGLLRPGPQGLSREIPSQALFAAGWHVHYGLQAAANRFLWDPATLVDYQTLATPAEP
jgi:hypothetical protein